MPIHRQNKLNELLLSQYFPKFNVMDKQVAVYHTISLALCQMRLLVRIFSTIKSHV